MENIEKRSKTEHQNVSGGGKHPAWIIEACVRSGSPSSAGTLARGEHDLPATSSLGDAAVCLRRKWAAVARCANSAMTPRPGRRGPLAAAIVTIAGAALTGRRPRAGDRRRSSSQLPAARLCCLRSAAVPPCRVGTKGISSSPPPSTVPLPGWFRISSPGLCCTWFLIGFALCFRPQESTRRSTLGARDFDDSMQEFFFSLPLFLPVAESLLSAEWAREISGIGRAITRSIKSSHSKYRCCSSTTATPIFEITRPVLSDDLFVSIFLGFRWVLLFFHASSNWTGYFQTVDRMLLDYSRASFDAIEFSCALLGVTSVYRTWNQTILKEGSFRTMIIEISRALSSARSLAYMEKNGLRVVPVEWMDRFFTSSPSSA